MNTKIKKITFLLLFILSIIFMTVFYIHSSSNCITVNNIENYCVKNSTCKSKNYYIKKFDNYYFAVSTSGLDTISDELFIFNTYKYRKNLLEVFGSCKPSASNGRNSYSYYITNFPDGKKYSAGSSMVIFSGNRDKISKGIITIKENDNAKDITYDLNPNDGFIIKIDQLGEIDGVKKSVVAVHFYNSANKEIPEYILLN